MANDHGSDRAMLMKCLDPANHHHFVTTEIWCYVYKKPISPSHVHMTTLVNRLMMSNADELPKPI